MVRNVEAMRDMKTMRRNYHVLLGWTLLAFCLLVSYWGGAFQSPKEAMLGFLVVTVVFLVISLKFGWGRNKRIELLIVDPSPDRHLFDLTVGTLISSMGTISFALAVFFGLGWFFRDVFDPEFGVWIFSAWIVLLGSLFVWFSKIM